MILGLHPLLRRLLVRGAPSPDGAPH
jgi:hypothetical protein